MIKFTKKYGESDLSPEVYSVLFPPFLFVLFDFVNISLHLSCLLYFSLDFSVFVHLVYVPTFVHSARAQSSRPCYPPFLKEFCHNSYCFFRILAVLPQQSCKLSLFRIQLGCLARTPIESIPNKVCALCTYTILNSISFTHFERKSKPPAKPVA